MTHRLTLVLAIATVSFAALVSGAAASHGHGHGKGTLFTFNGELLATPGANAGSISVEVQGGNRPALRALIGASQNQVFTVGSATRIVIWTQGVPHIGSTAELQQGDYVSVKIRAPRGASLQTLTQTPAHTIAERAAPRRHQPLWLFAGTAAGPGSGGHIGVHVESGNWKALHAMLGQPVDQSFTYDDGTMFVRWQGGNPTVIDASQVAAGDRVVVRIRAARSSSLGQVTATPANRVGVHEPPPAPMD
jgi:hypothetical protein